MQKPTRKRIVIVALVAICVATVAVVMLSRPRRSIVIDVRGAAGREVKVSFVVDGREESRVAKLPARLTLHARDVSYRIIPADRAIGHNITVHAHTEDNKWDNSSTAWAVEGGISCPKVLGGGPRAGIWIHGISGTSPDLIE